MPQSNMRASVEFVVIDGKVVPVSFNAYRPGMFPDTFGEFPEIMDGGQMEDMVADFLKDFGVDLDEWDDDKDGGMGKQELVAAMGELLVKAAKKKAQDEEDGSDNEDDGDEEDDEDDEDEEDEEDDTPTPTRHDKRHPKNGQFVAKQVEAILDGLLSKKHVGFNKLASSIAAHSGVDKERAKAIAAAIGRKKYGGRKMAAAAHAGKPLKQTQAKK